MRTMMIKAIVGLSCLALMFTASAASHSGHHDTLAKPAERCTTDNRGTVKWVRDYEYQLWTKWRCVCNIGRITVCKWKMIEVRQHLRIRSLLPNGTWYTPAGWHKHLHFVYAHVPTGGYCGHWWTTWHFVPERLR